jgi:DNA-binding PadR family transcriptional regulator
MEDLKAITAGKYIPEAGAVYTMLRRMEDRSLLTSKWEKKETGADRRVYTLSESGLKALKEGLKMVKARRELMDGLVKYYDDNFSQQGGT